jgi:hypothetical protein
MLRDISGRLEKCAFGKNSNDNFALVSLTGSTVAVYQ